MTNATKSFTSIGSSPLLKKNSVLYPGVLYSVYPAPIEIKRLYGPHTIPPSSSKAADLRSTSELA
jgi:hypothetical protein